jgi:hypothetical protein
MPSTTSLSLNTSARAGGGLLELELAFVEQDYLLGVTKIGADSIDASITT